MHVVADVRGDEGEARQPVCAKIAAELGQRHDAAEACRLRDDVAKVEKRHVTLGVQPRGRAGEASMREPLGVALPGQVRTLEAVRQVLRGDDAGRAVVADPLRAARDERDVVRQARVRDAAVARQRHVLGGQRVEVRRVGIPDDVLPRLVLDHDHDDVVELRDGDPLRGGPAERSEQRQQHDDDERALHGSMTLFLHTCMPATTTTTRAATAPAPYSPYCPIASAAAWPP